MIRYSQSPYSFESVYFVLYKKSHPMVTPMIDDITYRLNANSISWVYSLSLPALIVYMISNQNTLTSPSL